MKFWLSILIGIIALAMGLIWNYFDTHALTISIRDVPAQELKGVFIP